MATHNDYRLCSIPAGVFIEPCPCCGAEAAVWDFSERPDQIVRRVVMCSHGTAIGPQDGLVNEGCLLYMPHDQFYRDTAKDAVRYWNEFARSLGILARSNRWQRAKALRTTPEGAAKGGE
jgi:hypothetical protein